MNEKHGTIRLFIVEDQAMVREAIASLLSLEDNIEVVGQSENGKQALTSLAHLNYQVDVVLTDIEMPHISGLELAGSLHEQAQQVNVMIMTTFSKPGYIKQALDLGVKAFVLKEAPTAYLVEAINKVYEGQRFIDPELALMALDDKNPLSEKERRAIKLAGEGMKTKDISASLFLSEGTVRNYLSEAISKLNAVNRIDAARIAKQKGWI
jgi:two-component system response regulator DesR